MQQRAGAAEALEAHEHNRILNGRLSKPTCSKIFSPDHAQSGLDVTALILGNFLYRRIGISFPLDTYFVGVVAILGEYGIFWIGRMGKHTVVTSRPKWA